jgi:Tol biopolymer transport system component
LTAEERARVAAGGGGIHQLTHTTGGNVNNGFDSWSSDGTKLAFASNRGGSYAIYAMNADGTDVTQLSRGPKPTTPPGDDTDDRPAPAGR